MTETTAPSTVVDHLVDRLLDLRVGHVFGAGVPEHHPLRAVLAQSGVRWVDLRTELFAGFAAYGSGRVGGLGVVCTGSLHAELVGASALAVAHDESTPVLHIALGGGWAPLQEMVARAFSCAAADLRADHAPAHIDRVLDTMLALRRPGVIRLRDGLTAPPRDVIVTPQAVRRAPAEPDEPSPEASPGRVVPTGTGLDLDTVWISLLDALRPSDVVVVGARTPVADAVQHRMPTGTIHIGRSRWSAVSSAIPVAVGAALAAPDRRVVVVLSDLAVQAAALDIATLLEHEAEVLLVIVSAAEGGDRPAGDRWRWERFIASVGRDDVLGITAQTAAELDTAVAWSGAGRARHACVLALLS